MWWNCDHIDVDGELHPNIVCFPARSLMSVCVSCVQVLFPVVLTHLFNVSLVFMELVCLVLK